MRRQQLLIGIIATHFVLLIFFFGISGSTLFVALLLSGTYWLVHKFDVNEEKVNESSHHMVVEELFPHIKQQLSQSISLSEHSLGSLLKRFEQVVLQVNELSTTLEERPLSVDETKQAMSLINEYNTQVLTLLQFGDTTHQLQAGLIEVVDRIADELKESNGQSGLLERENLRNLLRDISARTMNSHYHHQGGGEVTFFNERDKE